MIRSMIAVLTLLSFTTVSAQKVLEKESFNTISLSPLSMFSVRYERVAQQKYGFDIEGSANYWKSNLNCDFSFQYNHYYKKVKMTRSSDGSKKGMKFYKIGPFVKYVHREQSVEEKDIDYDYNADYITPGFQFGRKRIFNSGFTIDTRIGYGFPIPLDDFEWENGIPADSHETVENINRFAAGFNLGLGLGFSF